MKKVLVALVIIALLVSLCACSVPSNSFMSKAQVNSLVKKYPNPQAEITLKYKTGNTNFEVKVTYNLLLDKAPIAVTRFIQIANEGGYNNTLVDTLNTTYKYVVMGRYRHEQEGYYNARSEDVSFAGEFQSNKYRKPKGGYAEFKIFSLAMFHDNDAEHFDAANGAMILALSNQTLNSANYAVFAKFDSMKVSTDDGATYATYDKVASYVRDHLMGFTTRSSKNVYESYKEGAKTVSVSLMSTEVTLNVEILGDYDWSKLPTIG